MKRPNQLFTSLCGLFACLLLACEDSAQANPAIEAAEKEMSGPEKAKRMSMSEMMKIGREIEAHKKKVGYKEPAEVAALSEEIRISFEKVQELKQNHPDIIAIKAEGAEAQQKLIEAIQNKDEAAKNKWAPIAGSFASKEMAVIASIPEIRELEEKSRAAEQKMHQLEYEALAATPGGKEIADKYRAMLKASTR